MIPRGFIAQLCLALALRPDDPGRFFVIFTAYFDESGTHGRESPVTVMGGVMANAQRWARFESKFRRAQRKHGFKTFHTKKFKNKKGDFKGWSPEMGIALIDDLAAMIADDALTEAVIMTLDNKEYDSDYRSGDTPRKLRLDSKYGLCFRECLLHCIRVVDANRHKGRAGKLHVVLESGHPNAGDAERIFHEVQIALRGTDVDVLKTITFADKTECHPLMIADSLAHMGFLRETTSRLG